MDAHFREYLAAVAGMQDVYGFNEHAGVEAAEPEACREAAPANAEQVCDCATAA